MSDYQQRVNESLSALADGELGELELQRLLRELDGPQRDKLRGRWQSYHQQRAVLRGERIDFTDISAAISVAIDAEPVLRKSRWSSFGSGFGRVAVAASVAVFALVGVQQLQSSGGAQPALEFAQESLEVEHYNGPAVQFPAGFRPNLNAQTVSARSGGSAASSRPVAVPASATMSEAEYLHSRNYLLTLLQRHQAQSASIANPALLPVMLPATLPDGRQSQ